MLAFAGDVASEELLHFLLVEHRGTAVIHEHKLGMLDLTADRRDRRGDVFLAADIRRHKTETDRTVAGHRQRDRRRHLVRRNFKTVIVFFVLDVQRLVIAVRRFVGAAIGIVHHHARLARRGELLQVEAHNQTTDFVRFGRFRRRHQPRNRTLDRRCFVLERIRIRNAGTQTIPHRIQIRRQRLDNRYHRRRFSVNLRRRQRTDTGTEFVQLVPDLPQAQAHVGHTKLQQIGIQHILHARRLAQNLDEQRNLVLHQVIVLDLDRIFRILVRQRGADIVHRRHRRRQRFRRFGRVGVLRRRLDERLIAGQFLARPQRTRIGQHGVQYCQLLMIGHFPVGLQHSHRVAFGRIRRQRFQRRTAPRARQRAETVPLVGGQIVVRTAGVKTGKRILTRMTVEPRTEDNILRDHIHQLRLLLEHIVPDHHFLAECFHHAVEMIDRTRKQLGNGRALAQLAEAHFVNLVNRMRVFRKMRERYGRPQ